LGHLFGDPLKDVEPGFELAELGVDDLGRERRRKGG